MEEFKREIFGRAIDNVMSDVEKEGVGAGAERVLAEANIKPFYSLEEKDPVLFAESRDKLNTEGGLVIANHPGYFDTFLILNALKRKDVKIVISTKGYDEFAPLVGEDMLIKASNEPTEALSFLRSVKQHIESGGLVMIYPSGGDKRVDDDHFSLEFRDGLAVILRKCMKDTDMIYSFYVNPSDLEPMINEKIPRKVGVLSALAINENLNINDFKSEQVVAVNEKYSTASEWKKVLNDSDKDVRNETLKQHFLDQVGFNQKTTL